MQDEELTQHLQGYMNGGLSMERENLEKQFLLLIPFTSVCGKLFVEKLHSDLIPN